MIGQLKMEVELFKGQEDQSGLGPGIYKLILRDGCNTFEFIHTISTPEVLEIILDEKVNILCHDDSTGKINISVNGGTAPLIMFGKITLTMFMIEMLAMFLMMEFIQAFLLEYVD